MNLKSKLFVFLIILCVLFSITSVSASDDSMSMVNAEDNSQLTQDLEDIDEDANLKESGGEGDPGTFTELHQDIMDSGGTFNMTRDYVCSESDSSDSSIYNIERLVINGKGHIIDCNNTSSVLTFINASDDAEGEITKNRMNVTINDVVFKNFNAMILSFTYGDIVLNNITIIDCSCNSTSAIGFSDNSTLIFNNSNINLDHSDGFLWGMYSKIIINNTNISVVNGFGPALLQNRGQAIIENSRFENFFSPNGPMLNFKGDYFSIRNSKFINSHAEFNGGAIIAKYFPISGEEHSDYLPSDVISIENCEFYNISSSDDGGAIFVDFDSASEHISKTLSIVNSNFTNCSSRFGGAIALLGGCLNIDNSNFIDNSAGFEGGAIYSSWANVTITNSVFSNNVAEKNAGAIYFDKGKLSIINSKFLANKANRHGASDANAIYAYDVDAYFADSTFDNGGVGVYADFASNSKLVNVTKNEDIFLLDNKNYIVSVESEGMKLDLANNHIIVDKLPESFDSRAWGWVTPMKIQGDNDDCWAFATVASLESALLKSTGKEYNLSQNYIQQLQLKYRPTGDLRISLTGFAYSGLGYALSWTGVLPLDKPYNDRGVIGDVDSSQARIHLQDAMIILGNKNDTRDLIKRAILKYGAVTVQLVFNDTIPDVDSEGEDIAEMDHGIHFISLIGWDDNWAPDEPDFGPENESSEDVVPDNITKGGVWICKDSLGEFHMTAYDDPTLLGIDYYAIFPQNPAIAYIFENTIDYHVNYQTDLTSLAGFDSNYSYYSNEFISKYSELIGAVGTYFNESGINYSFDIYVNGVKVHSQSGVSEFGGFRTIVLNKYIPIQAGDKFKVVFKNNNLPFQAYSRQHYMPEMSFVSVDGNSWKDITLENRTVCLKVYTVRDDTKIIDNKNIAVDYSGGSYFSVRVVTADGRAVGAGAIVKFTINGKTVTVRTDDNGIAKIKITQLPKKYTITTTYNGIAYKNTVTVKQVLTAYKVTIKKKTAKKLVLKAKLKINGKLVKGKVIKFKFKGKTYKVKTNKKGIAQKTLSKKIIKKLKKGKKYTVKVTYLKTTIKTTVKVK